MRIKGTVCKPTVTEYQMQSSWVREKINKTMVVTSKNVIKICRLYKNP